MKEHDCKECKARELAAWREGRAAGLREARAALERLPEAGSVVECHVDHVPSEPPAEHAGARDLAERLAAKGLRGAVGPYVFTGPPGPQAEPLTEAVHPPGTLDAARALAEEAVARHEAKRKGEPPW